MSTAATFSVSLAMSSGQALEAAQMASVRLIAADRRGFGGSSPLPGRSFTDWAEDVAALADHLDLPTFDVIGHSGGGPHALATAAVLPQRVARVAVVAGAAPLDAGAAPGWGRYFEEVLPSASLTTLEGEGHISVLVNHADRFFAALQPG